MISGVGEEPVYLVRWVWCRGGASVFGEVGVVSGRSQCIW